MDFIHVGLVASSAANADRFYGELLGLPRTKEGHLDAEFNTALFGVDRASDLIYYGDGALVFEVFVTGQPEPSAGKISHTCVATADLADLVGRARDLGFEVREVPKGDKVITFIADADGNLFEVKQA